MIEHLKVYVDLIQAGPEYQELIEDMEYRVKIPMNTPSARLVRHIKDDSLTHYALKRAKAYQKSALLALHPFRGFEDNASQQKIIFYYRRQTPLYLIVIYFQSFFDNG